MGTFSIWHWLIVLLAIIVVFGTKKLKNIGADLGAAVKGFKDGIKDGSAESSNANAAAAQPVPHVTATAAAQPTTIDVEARQKS